jgi:hypothetical protein
MRTYPVQKSENTAVGIRHADHVVSSIRKKFALASPTSGGRSVGIVRSRTQVTEFGFCVYTIYKKVKLPLCLTNYALRAVDVRGVHV